MFTKILDKDTIVSGIKLKRRTRAVFYNSGHLLYGILAEDREIDGINFMKGDYSGVFFQEDGTLWPCYKKELNGFRDIKWGTPISNLKGMKCIKKEGTSKEGFYITAIKENEDLKIGDAKVDKIEYCFWNGKFYTVGVEFTGLDNLEFLKKYVTDKLGPPLPSLPGFSISSGNISNIFMWQSKDCNIMIYYYEKKKSSIVFMSREVYQKVFENQEKTYRNEKNKNICSFNLRRINGALQRYSYNHQGRFPKKLSELYPDYIKDLKVLTCPASKTEISKKEEIDEKTGYEYFGANLTTNSFPERVIVADKKGNHKDGRNVLFVNGKVKWVSEEEFQKLLNKSN